MYQGTWFVTIGTCLHNELDLAHGLNIYNGYGPQRMFMNERCMNVSTVLYKEK